MLIEKLEKYVEITSGQIMSRVTLKEGEGQGVGKWRVVIPKAISSEGFIAIEDMPEEYLKSEPPVDRVTRVDDIVIKLSTPFDSAIVTEETAGCVVPSFCAIIRSKGILDLNYLRAFLASKYCKEQLKASVAGAVMSILSIGKIQSINIPEPDGEVQKEIGKKFNSTREKIVLMKKIIDLEAKRNDIVFQEIVK